MGILEHAFLLHHDQSAFSKKEYKIEFTHQTASIHKLSLAYISTPYYNHSRIIAQGRNMIISITPSIRVIKEGEETKSVSHINFGDKVKITLSNKNSITGMFINMPLDKNLEDSILIDSFGEDVKVKISDITEIEKSYA